MVTNWYAGKNHHFFFNRLFHIFLSHYWRFMFKNSVFVIIKKKTSRYQIFRYPNPRNSEGKYFADIFLFRYFIENMQNYICRRLFDKTRFVQCVIVVFVKMFFVYFFCVSKKIIMVIFYLYYYRQSSNKRSTEKNARFTHCKKKKKIHKKPRI